MALSLHLVNWGVTSSIDGFGGTQFSHYRENPSPSHFLVSSQGESHLNVVPIICVIQCLNDFQANLIPLLQHLSYFYFWC